MHAGQRYEESVAKLRDCQQELDDLREQAKQLAQRFENVRLQRINLFQTCFTHVSKALSQVYKDLTRSSKHPLGGNAYLTLDNTDEPFLAGVRFTAMPPMKRFR
jgi:structural maintenance of chromosome 1